MRPFYLYIGNPYIGRMAFLAATKQLFEHFFPSVRPSVCLSHLFDNVLVIISSWNFQKLLPMTKMMSMQKVKVTGVKTQLSHDDVIKWKYFPRYWPFVRGIHRSPVNSPHKGQWRGALMFSLISAWINGWVNNGEAGDLRRHPAHYDVIVMSRFRTVTPVWIQIWWWNDAQSLMLLRRGALLFFKVICQISRSHG